VRDQLYRWHLRVPEPAPAGVTCRADEASVEQRDITGPFDPGLEGRDCVCVLVLRPSCEPDMKVFEAMRAAVLPDGTDMGLRVEAPWVPPRTSEEAPPPDDDDPGRVVVTASEEARERDWIVARLAAAGSATAASDAIPVMGAPRSSRRARQPRHLQRGRSTGLRDALGDGAAVRPRDGLWPGVGVGDKEMGR
jgi:hypothetical protein